MRSVDDNAEKFILAVKVFSADSIVKYREGDFNENVYIRGDGNSTPATPEDLVLIMKQRILFTQKIAGQIILIYVKSLEVINQLQQ